MGLTALIRWGRSCKEKPRPAIAVLFFAFSAALESKLSGLEYLWD